MGGRTVDRIPIYIFGIIGRNTNIERYATIVNAKSVCLTFPNLEINNSKTVSYNRDILYGLTVVRIFCRRYIRTTRISDLYGIVVMSAAHNQVVLFK